MISSPIASILRFLAISCVVSVVLLFVNNDHSSSSVDAWISWPWVANYAPNQKSYITDINHWYMMNGQVVDGLRAWVSNWYAQVGDTLGSDGQAISYQQS